MALMPYGGNAFAVLQTPHFGLRCLREEGGGHSGQPGEKLAPVEADSSFRSAFGLLDHSAPSLVDTASARWATCSGGIPSPGSVCCSGTAAGSASPAPAQSCRSTAVPTSFVEEDTIELTEFTSAPRDMAPVSSRKGTRRRRNRTTLRSQVPNANRHTIRPATLHPNPPRDTRQFCVRSQSPACRRRIQVFTRGARTRLSGPPSSSPLLNITRETLPGQESLPQQLNDLCNSHAANVYAALDLQVLSPWGFGRGPNKENLTSHAGLGPRNCSNLDSMLRTEGLVPKTVASTENRPNTRKG
jgi:hypothetical protein